jgi:transposase-like protein
VTTVTVLSGPERRRRWTTAEKLRIVEESFPNLLTVWRRQARTGAFGCGTEVASRQDDDVHFAPVSVAPEQQTLMAPSGSCEAIEIEFANGARLRITGVVDRAR